MMRCNAMQASIVDSFCIFICVENDDYYLVENKTLMNFMKINMQINGDWEATLAAATAAAAVPYRICATTSRYDFVNEIIFYKFHIFSSAKW